MNKVITDLKFVSYDGKYPTLCMGNLKFVAIFSDGSEKEYNWKDAITSTGGLDDDYEAYTGDWDVHLPLYREEEDYSEFTPMVLYYLEKLVNENVPRGCCGGCS